jgi:transposase
MDAVRLVMDRGVAVAQAACDLDVAESVESMLWRWMRELTATPAAAFSGNVQIMAKILSPRI